MAHIKKMSLVDPAFVEELKTFRNKSTIEKPESASNDQSSIVALSNTPTTNPFNTYNHGVLRKRMFGLKKFLTSLLNGRSKNLKYSRLSQYNNALSTLMRIYKFHGNALPPATSESAIPELDVTTSNTIKNKKTNDPSDIEYSDEGENTNEESEMDTDDPESAVEESEIVRHRNRFPEIKQGFSSLSQSAARRVRALMRLIQSSEVSSLSWDNGGTTYINGVPLQDSNIIDLAREVTVIRQSIPYRKAQYKPPPGWSQFATALRKYKLPRTIVQNKQRFIDIFGSPGIDYRGKQSGVPFSPRSIQSGTSSTPRSRYKTQKRKRIFSPAGVTPRRKHPDFGALGNFLTKKF